jgi:hypothetical protein
MFWRVAVAADVQVSKSAIRACANAAIAARCRRRHARAGDGAMSRTSGRLAFVLLLFCGPATAQPAGLVEAGTKQPTNRTAIGMFIAFVLLTLAITYRAAKRTRSTRDLCSAGGGITGFQNGVAIAGEYMSAACPFSASGRSSTVSAMTA